MLLLIMLGCIVRPMLGLAGELHLVQHALAVGCDVQEHTRAISHQHTGSQTGCHFMDEDGMVPVMGDASGPDAVDAGHAALLHQAEVGFVAALPVLPYVPDTFALALAPPSITRTGILPQPVSSPFRPPIAPSTPVCA